MPGATFFLDRKLRKMLSNHHIVYRLISTELSGDDDPQRNEINLKRNCHITDRDISPDVLCMKPPDGSSNDRIKEDNGNINNSSTNKYRYRNNTTYDVDEVVIVLCMLHESLGLPTELHYFTDSCVACRRNIH